MREILFRGQTRKRGEKVKLDGTPVNGNWVYGGIFPGSGDHSIIYTSNPIDKFTVYSDTVGQFTGLIDENGVNIFEGDIVRALGTYTLHKSYVRKGIETPDILIELLNKAKCGVVLFHTDDEDDGSGFKANDVTLFYCEVIGNIYDNPELLDKCV